MKNVEMDKTYEVLDRLMSKIQQNDYQATQQMFDDAWNEWTHLSTQNYQCSWCQVDVDIQPEYISEMTDTGVCKHCHSVIDAGQQIIRFNSIKQSYDGCITLMYQIIREFKDILEYLGVDLDAIKDELDEENVCISIPTADILRALFLGQTSNAGGTSISNLRRLLNEEDYSKIFPL